MQIYTGADGKVDTKRVYEQLALTGKGRVELTNPVSTDGLRNLDGFCGFDVKDGEQVVDTDVDGETTCAPSATTTATCRSRRGRLQPRRQADEGRGRRRRTGKLEVSYTVKNISAVPKEVTFDDGKGGTITKTVDVPIPMVGSLTTVAAAVLHQRHLASRPTWPATARAAPSCPSR